MLLSLLCGCIPLVPHPRSTAPIQISSAVLSEECLTLRGTPIPDELQDISAGFFNAEAFLSALSAWANAGTEAIGVQPEWLNSADPEECLTQLAALNRQNYQKALFSAIG
ncbi:hypothetical protein CQ018_18225 [Arthrobacter sp. MYb227]|nr:hypothetical protein CQ018_18225 [Arthrobacter sp. MYb227]